MQQRAHTAEVKIILVLAYYLFFVLVVLCQDAAVLAWRESFTNATNSYLLCEAVGPVPGKCDQKFIEQYPHTITILNCAEFVITVLIPVVNLVFVINCRQIKECLQNPKVTNLLRSSSTKSSQ